MPSEYTSKIAFPDAYARPPVTPIVYRPEGAYDAVRASPEQGSCGIHSYPCKHPGVDLEAPKGTAVQAPHDGWVLVSQATNEPPFKGYGPAVVLLAHDDGALNEERELAARPELKTRDTFAHTPFQLAPPNNYKDGITYRYSLLAHLDPDTLRGDLPMRQAQGLLDADNSKDYVKLDDGTLVRVYKWPSWAVHVKAGDYLGSIGDAGHVHWEIRTAPFGDSSTRVDPLGWLALYDPTTPWTTAKPSPLHEPRKGPGLIAIAAGLWLANELLG